MLDVCQIPEDKLQGMTTEALLETVLAYPLITDYYAYNSIEDACDIMYNEFNGFRELFSKNDVRTVLTENMKKQKFYLQQEQSRQRHRNFLQHLQLSIYMFAVKL